VGKRGKKCSHVSCRLKKKCRVSQCGRAHDLCIWLGGERGRKGGSVCVRDSVVGVIVSVIASVCISCD